MGRAKGGGFEHIRGGDFRVL